MTETYSYYSAVRVNGEVYRSRTEGMWAAFLTIAEIPFAYEPYTFELPDKSRYTPDLLVAGQRYVEIKNGNAGEEAYRKINMLARFIGTHTVLIDGIPKKNTKLTVFDGRTPEPSEHRAPANGFGYSDDYFVSPASFIARLLQTEPYDPSSIPKIDSYKINERTKNFKQLISYDVTAQEIEALQNKLHDPSRIVYLHSSDTAYLEKLQSAPPRKVDPVALLEMPDMSTGNLSVF